MIMRVSKPPEHTFTDGPGVRIGIFFQGCLKHCKSCEKPETWPMFGGERVDTEVITKLIEQSLYLDGITLTGGEPFLQPVQALILAQHAKQRGLSVWCYSGYTFEEITEWQDNRKALLKTIDVLVDGPFKEELKINKDEITTYSNNLWLKSTNQRIIDVEKSLKKGDIVLYEPETEGSTL